jgi:hypothetical protein
LNIKDLLHVFDPAAYRYILTSGDNNVNIATSDLSPGNAGDYLTVVETARASAHETVIPVRSSGVDFSGLKPTLIPYGSPDTDPTGIKKKLNDFLLAIRDQDKGILLVEGAKIGKKPLTLSVYDQSNNRAFICTLNLSLDGVEQMFRHVNLINVATNEVTPPQHMSKWGEPGRSGERVSGSDLVKGLK